MSLPRARAFVCRHQQPHAGRAAAALQRAGIVRRHSYPESPPRVEYELTDKGRDLLPILDAMTDFGSSWLIAAEAQLADA